MFVQKTTNVAVVAKSEWVLVGEQASDSILVRGGMKPVSIRVSHPDSQELIQLLAEANAGIAAEVAKPDLRSKNRLVLGSGLREIALQVQGWLDWNRKDRTKHDLVTDGNTQIMALPVPSWPTHWQLKNWIEELNLAADALDGGELAAGEVK
jgi:hypothetical protein